MRAQPAGTIGFIVANLPATTAYTNLLGRALVPIPATQDR
jgi:hypothetical protein